MLTTLYTYVYKNCDRCGNPDINYIYSTTDMYHFKMLTGGKTNNYCRSMTCFWKNELGRRLNTKHERFAYRVTIDRSTCERASN